MIVPFLGDDLSGFQDIGSICGCEGLLYVLLDDQYRCSLLLDLLDRIEYLPDEDRTQVQGKVRQTSEALAMTSAPFRWRASAAPRRLRFRRAVSSALSALAIARRPSPLVFSRWTLASPLRTPCPNSLQRSSPQRVFWPPAHGRFPVRSAERVHLINWIRFE